MYMLVDLNQVLISNLMMHLKNVKKSTMEPMSEKDLLRHMCINSIRSNVRQFKSKYPTVVLACDNKHYWRRDYFPFYKAARKEARDASGHDWSAIFEVLNELRDDLRDHFPYRVVNVEGAEADDVIGVLTARLAPHGAVLIVSGDKDFGQLQKYPNVAQYSPILKRFIQIDDPSVFLKQHIIKGDRGDGIPNILSADNTFVVGDRQKPINSKKLAEWVTQDATTFCSTDDILRGYKRNQMLVDFDYIPTEVQSRIVDAYENAAPAPKEKMLKYFIDNGLMAMVESISDF